MTDIADPGVSAAAPRPGVAVASPGADSDPQSAAPYLEALAELGPRHHGRFGTPGHKGGLGADPALREALGDRALMLDLPRDTPGIAGDSPTPLDRAAALAARAYGANRAWFLNNGATSGNHALCLTLAPLGSRVILQRNSHGSLIDGLVLSGGAPTLLSPEYDEELEIAHCVKPENLALALERTPDARAAFIVSPTYFGMVADVERCAEVAHCAGIPLIVDAAWGAHLGFHPSLPGPPLRLGADAIIASTHKMVGSLTQSAMLMISDSGRVDAGALGRALRLLRSTSPNSLMYASLDAARRQLAHRGAELLERTLSAAARVRARIEAIEGCTLVDERLIGEFGIVGFDPLKLVVDVRGTGCTGYEIAHELYNRHDTHVELATGTSILYLLAVAQPLEPLERIPENLAEVVARIGREQPHARAIHTHEQVVFEPAVTPREAFLGRSEVVAVSEAVGRIATEAISVYPRGVPSLLPGVEIAAEAVDFLREQTAAGAILHGAEDPSFETVRVLVG